MWLRDFGSTNGTLVNGVRVAGQQQLKHGDRLAVAELEFEVQISVSVGGQKKPKVRTIQEAATRTALSGAPDEDLDITQWLGEDEADQSQAAAETKSHASASSDPTRVETGGKVPPPPHAPGTPTVEQETAAPEPKEQQADQRTTKGPGTLPKAPKPRPATSGEAAAEILKDYFKRL